MVFLVDAILCASCGGLQARAARLPLYLTAAQALNLRPLAYMMVTTHTSDLLAAVQTKRDRRAASPPSAEVDIAAEDREKFSDKFST
jgi:hypothetical protein